MSQSLRYQVTPSDNLERDTDIIAIFCCRNPFVIRSLLRITNHNLNLENLERESQSLRYQVTPSDPEVVDISEATDNPEESQSLRYQVTPSDYERRH